MTTKELPDMSTWTSEQIAEFWLSHSTVDYWDKMEEANDLEIEKRLKPTVALRLDADDVDKIKALAHRQGIGHTTLMRIWIKEKLESVAL